MDRKDDIREFLISRRAKVSPEQAGIPNYGELRRVPGLRREEVAQLARVSTDYYTRLERGGLRGVSDSVLEAVASALQLDGAERAHLMDLARTANAPKRRAPRRPPQQRVRPGVLRLLDGMAGVAAMVQNGHSDVLAANLLGRALYASVFNSDVSFGPDVPGKLPNQARYLFLDPGAGDLYPDWNAVAATTVAMLRLESGRNPHDRLLHELVGELTTRSGPFAALWAGHDVRIHTTGTKRFHHPVAGDLSLQFETLHLPGDQGQTLFTFTAEPGSAAGAGLAFLASWASSPSSAPARATAQAETPTNERHNNPMTEQTLPMKTATRRTGKKVWFITGAGRGLGTDIAKAALAAGHAVVATGRTPEKVALAVGSHEDLLTVKLDVTDPANAAAAVQAAVDRFGGIDVLVNNAGNFFAGFFEEISPQDFRTQIETTMFGPMNVTRAALPVLRAQRSGLLVTISSTAGIAGGEFLTAYAASKFGVEGWAESLAPEVAPFGIRSTIVEPGFFRTELLTPESTRYADSTIEDYADRTEQTVTTWKSMDGRQGGDPAKLADALIKLAALDEPPLRFAAGADAVGTFEDRAKLLQEQAGAHRELSSNLAFSDS
ncbi:SDR family NAD(P)-dependent oxidoreductase [Pseudarthrobacter sp. NPDC058196]|uniref:SDR family NAD(P)-dependent oxidoreductase n=1 Tax=Pseudarthrobacter sp. NPDC058196 TaxID=3346376 RepID=UPI0036DE6B87